MNTKYHPEQIDDHRDPITSEPGSHPVGTGVGSAGGAMAGAAIGGIGGPVGAAVGGVIGAIVGGLAGHEVAEGIDPTAEEAYWYDNYRNEPYYKSEYDFTDYGPAYRMGYSFRGRSDKLTFEEAESELARNWEGEREGSRLDWDGARDAVRAGWHRPEPSLSGEVQRDVR